MADHYIETAFLDTSGQKCPIPVIKAKKMLKSLSVGDVLKIKTTDPLALIDIPHMCNELKYQLLKTSRFEDYNIFYVRKG